jgi:hypothetical protein
MTQAPRHETIATSSVEEGLDFACSLLSSAVPHEGKANPEKTQQLLNELAQYIRLRYVGELLLALEYLAGLGDLCDPSLFQSKQFWAQLRWVADKMNLSATEKEKLEIPNG